MLSIAAWRCGTSLIVGLPTPFVRLADAPRKSPETCDPYPLGKLPAGCDRPAANTRRARSAHSAGRAERTGKNIDLNRHESNVGRSGQVTRLCFCGISPRRESNSRCPFARNGRRAANPPVHALSVSRLLFVRLRWSSKEEGESTEQQREERNEHAARSDQDCLVVIYGSDRRSSI